MLILNKKDLKKKIEVILEIDSIKTEIIIETNKKEIKKEIIIHKTHSMNIKKVDQILNSKDYEILLKNNKKDLIKEIEVILEIDIIIEINSKG